uniref:Uncharacterized protein n=1 Tax=Arundo donax TaxID=35708 RepID=A0A0A9G5Q3_ARUDO
MAARRRRDPPEERRRSTASGSEGVERQLVQATVAGSSDDGGGRLDPPQNLVEGRGKIGTATATASQTLLDPESMYVCGGGLRATSVCVCVCRKTPPATSVSAVATVPVAVVGPTVRIGVCVKPV